MAVICYAGSEACEICICLKFSVGHSTVILFAFDPHDWLAIDRLANIYLFFFGGGRSYDMDWIGFGLVGFFKDFELDEVNKYP